MSVHAIEFTVQLTNQPDALVLDGQPDVTNGSPQAPAGISWQHACPWLWNSEFDDLSHGQGVIPMSWGMGYGSRP